jgi:hypothetical protein
MTKEAKKLLENQSIGVAVHVTNKRLQKFGIEIAPDLNVTQRRHADRNIKVPPTVTKRLVG